MCDGLVSRPKESYQCINRQRSPRMRRRMSFQGLWSNWWRCLTFWSTHFPKALIAVVQNSSLPVMTFCQSERVFIIRQEIPHRCTFFIDCDVLQKLLNASSQNSPDSYMYCSNIADASLRGLWAEDPQSPSIVPSLTYRLCFLPYGCKQMSSEQNYELNSTWETFSSFPSAV
jgi:hypothetical protein